MNLQWYFEAPYVEFGFADVLDGGTYYAILLKSDETEEMISSTVVDCTGVTSGVCFGFLDPGVENGDAFTLRVYYENGSNVIRTPVAIRDATTSPELDDADDDEWPMHKQMKDERFFQFF